MRKFKKKIWSSDAMSVVVSHDMASSWNMLTLEVYYGGILSTFGVITPSISGCPGHLYNIPVLLLWFYY